MMGWEYQRLEITAMVSRHNAPQDKEHDQLWSELRSRIDELLGEERYEDIHPMRL